MVKFDKNGFGGNVFTENDYHGTAATAIAYDLRKDGNPAMSNYDGLVSHFLVREYVADGRVKIAVSNWSNDPAIRKNEEKLVGELVKLGAEKISGAEMEKLCSLAPYEADVVTWKDWIGESQSAQANETDINAVISVNYASEELLNQPNAFHEYIARNSKGSEYQVKALISTNVAVKDFCVLSLNVEDFSEDGKLICSSTKLYRLNTLTPAKPLVVGIMFVGDTPNMGISYVDGDGAKHEYAIGMSGEDSSLLLSEVYLKQ